MTAGKEKQIYSKCGERSPANVGVDSMSERRELPSRHEHVTQKVRVPARTLYITVHRDPNPAELLLRMKGEGCTVEVVALYDVIAQLASLACNTGLPWKRSATCFRAPSSNPLVRCKATHVSSLPHHPSTMWAGTWASIPWAGMIWPTCKRTRSESHVRLQRSRHHEPASGRCCADEAVSRTAGRGDRARDCAYRTIAAMTQTKSTLVTYAVKAITGGTDAQGEVMVKVEEGPKTVTGHGADTDIIVASAKAYLNALNKLAYWKSKKDDAPKIHYI